MRQKLFRLLSSSEWCIHSSLASLLRFLAFSDSDSASKHEGATTIDLKQWIDSWKTCLVSLNLFNCLTLDNSFSAAAAAAVDRIIFKNWRYSAVSKPNCASKYALESSRRDLQNALLCTVLVAQFFVWKSLTLLPFFAKYYLPNFC